MGHSPHASSPHDGVSGGNHHPRHHASPPSSQHHTHWEREHESLQAHQQSGASSSWNPYTVGSTRQSSRSSATSSPRDYPISSRVSNTRHSENGPSPQQQNRYVHSASTPQVDFGRQARPASPIGYPQHPSSEQHSDFQPHSTTGLSPRFLPQQPHTERRKRKRSIEQSPPLDQHVSQSYRISISYTATFFSYFVLICCPVAVLQLGICVTTIVTWHDSNTI